jgi:hypothetical protein
LERSQLSGTTSNRTRATFRTNGFPCPRTINVKECFKFDPVVVLQFIFECGSRGGAFQIFTKVVPHRHNSVEEGTSEIGSSTKVGSVAVG